MVVKLLAIRILLSYFLLYCVIRCLATTLIRRNSTMENIPPTFPKTLKGFGYDFNKAGRLRKLDPETGMTTNQGFEFSIYENELLNQQRYEALGTVLEEYVYNLLEDEGLERLPVPKSSPPELQTFIFASKDALKRNKKLMIFIHGSGVVRAGQWARRLIINENLYSGTQIPYIRKAKRLGYEILVLNTNDNYRMYKGKKTKIPSSEDAYAHMKTVWNDYIKPSPVEKIAIVGHSYGGVITVKFGQEHPEEFKKRVFAVALTDSVHVMPTQGCDHIIDISRNWVSSDLSLDTPVHTPTGDIPCFSAGHPVHENTSAACLDSVFEYVEHQYNKKYLRNEIDRNATYLLAVVIDALELDPNNYISRLANRERIPNSGRPPDSSILSCPLGRKLAF